MHPTVQYSEGFIEYSIQTTHTMQTINYKIFSSIKPNLNFFVKLFGLTIFFYFFQNRFWLGIKHFSNPNESVHSELLHIFPPTCSAVLIGICQSLRKDDSCSSALAIYCTIIIYLGSTRISYSFHTDKVYTQILYNDIFYTI